MGAPFETNADLLSPLFALTSFSPSSFFPFFSRSAMGVVVAFIAYYIAYASILTKNTSYFTLPLGSLAVKD